MNIQTVMRLLFLGLLLIPFYSSEGQPPDDFGIGAGERIDTNVNSEWAEILPVVSPDSKYLYFSRKEAPENTGGTDDLEDIYYSERQADGSWGPAKNAGEPLNSLGSDLLFSFSDDGNAALIYSGKEINGKERGLAIARKKNGRWQEPKKLSIEGLDDLGDYYYAHMSFDGKHLFISYAPDKNRPLNLDLFYSTALSDDMMKWSKPVAMPGMDSPFIEGSPFLTPDQRTLYLISDRPGGNGMGDVYVIRRTGDDWDHWTFLEELGGNLSTPMFESSISISPDGTEAYVSRTNQAGLPYGRLDIYRYPLPKSLNLISSYEVRGQVIDRNTRKGIEAEVSVSPQREDKIVAVKKTEKDGTFSIVSLPGITIVLRANAPGYKTGGITFDGRRFDPSMELPSVTIEVDKDDTTPVTIPTLYFATGTASITRESQRKLQKFAEWLTEFPQQIEVVGHTDNVGTPENNMRLGKQRAEAVKDYLITLDIPANSMVTKSYGETQPTETNSTSRGKRANRRVEINVPGHQSSDIQRGRLNPTKRIRQSRK